MSDDELVEKIARAMWMADVEPYDLADRIPFEQARDTAQEYCRAEARAALVAARPVIRAEALEEAARVCEARYMGDNNREDMEARRCAAAIRALISNPRA